MCINIILKVHCCKSQKTIITASYKSIVDETLTYVIKHSEKNVILLFLFAERVSCFSLARYFFLFVNLMLTSLMHTHQLYKY